MSGERPRYDRISLGFMPEGYTRLQEDRLSQAYEMERRERWKKSRQEALRPINQCLNDIIDWS